MEDFLGRIVYRIRQQGMPCDLDIDDPALSVDGSRIWLWWNRRTTQPRVLSIGGRSVRLGDVDAAVRAVLTLVEVARSSNQRHAWYMAFTKGTGIEWLDFVVGSRFHLRDQFRLVLLHDLDSYSPSLKAWNDGCITKMVLEMCRSGDFSTLPILADALEDAGCDRQELFARYRGPLTPPEEYVREVRPQPRLIPTVFHNRR